MSYVRSIPVVDVNGDQLILFEFEDRRFISKTRRLRLDSGELVERINDDSFTVAATGEVLRRLAPT